MANAAVMGSTVAAAAAMEAAKAMGPIVCVEPANFLDIVEKNKDGIIVTSIGGFWSSYKYLTSYKGLIFFAKRKTPLMLPSGVEIINAKKIAVPSI